MAEIREDVPMQLQALAAVLAAVRGRLAELAASLPETERDGEESPGLHSIVSCILTDSIDPAIRDLLAASELEAASAPHLPPEVGDRDFRDLWKRLEAKLVQGERERAEGEALARGLLVLSSAQRVAALEDPRFHRPVVVDGLLEGAHGTLPADPALAGELASLAAAIAERLADPEESMEGRARAACATAHARRMGGDEEGAEHALSEATLYAAYADEQAALCRAVALLRWEQGRLDEAAAMLERAADLWASEELIHEHGACRVLRALLMIEEGKARDSVELLQNALPLLIDPWLTLYGGLALALGLAERGVATKARARRAESVALVHLTPPAANLFARRLEAMIALALGEHEDAERLLEEVRRQAIDRGWLPEAAVATLDLARLDVERGGAAERAEERASELEAAFAGTKGLEGLLPILRGLAEQLPVGESLQDFTASVAAMFLRVLRLSGVRSAPLPFT